MPYSKLNKKDIEDAMQILKQIKIESKSNGDGGFISFFGPSTLHRIIEITSKIK